jgi:hypothetical protein
MPVIVTLNLQNRTTLVEADKIERDPHLEGNLLLFGTKNLALPTPDEKNFITTVWSVPKTMVQFYAVGHREVVAPPAPVEPTPARASEPPPFIAEAAEALAADRARATAPSEPEAAPVEEPAPPVKRKGTRKPKAAAEVPATE